MIFKPGCNQGGVSARWAHNGGEIFQMLGNQVCCKNKSLNFQIRHDTHYPCPWDPWGGTELSELEASFALFPGIRSIKLFPEAVAQMAFYLVL